MFPVLPMISAQIAMQVAAVCLLAMSLKSIRAEDPKFINHDDHVAAILKRHCLQCHGASKQEAGLDLSSYVAIKKGGSGGPVVVAGRASASRLLKAITAENAEERMPPDNDPLPKDQIATIRTWIDSGLRQNAGSSVAPSPATTGFIPSTGPGLTGPPPMPGVWPVVQRMKTARPFPVLALATSPRAPLAAFASYECVDFIDPVTRKHLGSLPFQEGEPHILHFSRSGAILLAAGGRPVQNGIAALYDVKSGKRLAEFGNETDAVMAADLSPDEQRVAIGGSGRIIKLFSTKDGKLLNTLVKHTDWITSVAFSPDGKLLATGDRIGNIHLWDAKSGAVVLPLSEHKGAVRALTWRSDNKVLASCGEDGLIVWWDISKGWPETSKADAHPPQRPSGVYGKIANGVLDAAFGPQGELVTCGRDRMVRLWASDGREIKVFSIEDPANKQGLASGARTLPTRVGMAWNGATILAGDSAGNIHAWPIAVTK
jgi:hypothetical protein